MQRWKTGWWSSKSPVKVVGTCVTYANNRLPRHGMLSGVEVGVENLRVAEPKHYISPSSQWQLDWAMSIGVEYLVVVCMIIVTYD